MTADNIALLLIASRKELDIYSEYDTGKNRRCFRMEVLPLQKAMILYQETVGQFLGFLGVHIFE